MPVHRVSVSTLVMRMIAEWLTGNINFFRPGKNIIPTIIAVLFHQPANARVPPWIIDDFPAVKTTIGFHPSLAHIPYAAYRTLTASAIVRHKIMDGEYTPLATEDTATEARRLISNKLREYIAMKQRVSTSTIYRARCILARQKIQPDMTPYWRSHNWAFPAPPSTMVLSYFNSGRALEQYEILATYNPGVEDSRLDSVYGALTSDTPTMDLDMSVTDNAFLMAVFLGVVTEMLPESAKNTPYADDLRHSYGHGYCIACRLFVQEPDTATAPYTRVRLTDTTFDKLPLMFWIGNAYGIFAGSEQTQHTERHGLVYKCPTLLHTMGVFLALTRRELRHRGSI